MKKNNNIKIVSSTLKTIASENLVTEAELNTQDKPLEEVLNGQTQEDNKEATEQG